MKIIILICCMILLMQNAYTQYSKVNWCSLNMGYVEASSGNTMIKSLAGQTFVGTMHLLNTDITSGFLADTLFRRISVDVKEGEPLPTAYALWQNFPNPFNPSTIIRFDLPEESRVSLIVYNIIGQEVETLIRGNFLAGKYQVTFDGSRLANGIYFYRLTTGTWMGVRKLMLIK